MSRATVGIASLSAVAAVLLLSPAPGEAPKASARPTPEQVEAAISHAAATAPAVSPRH
ncbi:MAG: hypothetical protein QOG84_513 [Sphingomonadales bacterium]|jgi:hypothetical protein|nr:hypothetical protein [Sphingomonadales bacterium]